MAIGFHAVVGKRQFQTEVVGKVFDEVWADIDRMLVHGLVFGKSTFFSRCGNVFSYFCPEN